MSEREEKRGGPGCAIVGIVLILLPVLYVLSTGPLGWLANRFPETVGFFDVIYTPLGFVSDHGEPLGHALDWYMSFWL